MASELGDDIETRSDPPPPTRWRAVRPWLEGAGIALLLVGIVYVALGLRGGSSDDPAHRSAAGTTTSTSLSPEAEVEQAYRAFEAMLVRLSTAPNPDDPEIAQRTTGEFRARVERIMADRRARHLLVRFGAEAGPTSVSAVVHGGSATVKACYVDQAAIVNGRTGAVIDPMTTVHERLTVTLDEDRGLWKVSHFVVDRKPGSEELAACE
ncbi:MAG TPA: hypothetical protein VKB57_23855 [Acidimicrobiales bacterium]|nr:hypothetical protein [Acidimicrobiales bacterium]